MIKLDSIPPSVKSPVAFHFDCRPSGRLIVLLPAPAAYLPNPTRVIWEMARSSGSNVLLLSLCTDYYEESRLRRQLVTMSAMISDGKVRTEVRIEHGKDWVATAKNIYRPGDVIACYAGQRVGLRRRFLHEVLQSQLGVPIHILSADSPIRDSKPKWLLEASLWLGMLAIIGGFSWIEMKITQLPQDWVHTSFLNVCILIEIGLIWLWNSIFPDSP